MYRRHAQTSRLDAIRVRNLHIWCMCTGPPCRVEMYHHTEHLRNYWRHPLSQVVAPSQMLAACWLVMFVLMRCEWYHFRRRSFQYNIYFLLRQQKKVTWCFCFCPLLDVNADWSWRGNNIYLLYELIAKERSYVAPPLQLAALSFFCPRFVALLANKYKLLKVSFILRKNSCTVNSEVVSAEVFNKSADEAKKNRQGKVKFSDCINKHLCSFGRRPLEVVPQ